MDCNFRSGVDDFVVPKDQEISVNDNLPSPHSLLNWGTSAPESYGLASKRFLMDSSLPQTQMNPNGEILCDEDMMDASIRGNEQSSSLSLFEGSVDDIFNLTTTSNDRQDCQLDDLVELDTMDDIFLYSVSHGTWMLQYLCCITGHMNLSLKLGPLQNLAAIMKNGILFLKIYLGLKILRNHFVFHASQINTSVASGQNCIDECVHKETSVEESVLRELEMVIAQLTDKTRICFRDAFYRLAKKSERHIEDQRQQEDISVETLPSLIGQAEKERSGTQEDTESETNIIDRTIASLLFGNMQMFIENSPVEGTADANQEDTGPTGRPNHNLNQSQSQHFNHYPAYSSD